MINQLANLSPLAAQLLERMTALAPDHQRFQGAPVDITGLTSEALGWLWPTVQRARYAHLFNGNAVAQKVAEAILRQAEEIELLPAILDSDYCLEVFRGIVTLDQAVEYLTYMACEPPAGLAQQLRRILGTPSEWADFERYIPSFALAKLTDETTQAELHRLVYERYEKSPFLLLEFDMLPQIGWPALLAMAGAKTSYYWPKNEYGFVDPAVGLANDPAYAEIAHTLLSQAATRVQDIHSGSIPYKSDGAFTTYDTPALGRAARVAALRDEPWFGDIIARLLPGVCLAPTEAKSVPSQSLAITLGHSIEGVPTPESVHALREAIRVVRHEGVKKKISRNLKPAERGLAQRPELALRLVASAKPSKQQQRMLATCLETGFWQDMKLTWTDWYDRLANSVGGSALARALIWRVEMRSGERVSFMLDKNNNAFDCLGQALTLHDPVSVSLWHPLDADANERDAWQALIGQRRLKQPIRQAFREIYLPSENECRETSSALFAGHMLSIRPLIGLARSEGWMVDKWDGLHREFGAVHVWFTVSADLYPGATGWGESGNMYFCRRKGSQWQRQLLGDIPPAVFSEASRAVDLLVSVTAFALHNESMDLPLTLGDLGIGLAGQEGKSGERPVHPLISRTQRLSNLAERDLGQMATMRRNVLRQVLAAQISEGTVVVDARHVHVGDHAVHLATGRVTKSGAPIELDLSDAKSRLMAVPWLPYDEVLLNKIVNTISALLA